MIGEIQVLPNPSGDGAHRYRHVDAAIGVVAASGLTYEVGALGTTLEGDPNEVWRVLRAAHEAALRSGAEQVVTVLKVVEGRDLPGMGELVSAHRR